MCKFLFKNKKVNDSGIEKESVLLYTNNIILTNQKTIELLADFVLILI